MKHVKKIKKLALCIGAVLMQLEVGSVNADSSVGVDTALGNAMNPPGRNAIPREVDPDGIDTIRRSPTGQLYSLPPLAPEQDKRQMPGISVAVLRQV